VVCACSVLRATDCDTLGRYRLPRQMRRHCRALENLTTMTTPDKQCGLDHATWRPPPPTVSLQHPCDATRSAFRFLGAVGPTVPRARCAGERSTEMSTRSWRFHPDAHWVPLNAISLFLRGATSQPTHENRGPKESPANCARATLTALRTASKAPKAVLQIATVWTKCKIAPGSERTSRGAPPSTRRVVSRSGRFQVSTVRLILVSTKGFGRLSPPH